MGAGGWGERLRERGRALGLTDSEVARRLGLSQRRYSSYVNESREPGFADLLRICEVLRVTPDHVLGVDRPDPGDEALRRAGTALARLSAEQRDLAVAGLEGMAEAASRTEGRPMRGRPPRGAGRRGAVEAGEREAGPVG